MKLLRKCLSRKITSKRLRNSAEKYLRKGRTFLYDCTATEHLRKGIPPEYPSLTTTTMNQGAHVLNLLMSNYGVAEYLGLGLPLPVSGRIYLAQPPRNSLHSPSS
ncbi:uncharacterized protein LOC143038461 isoform X1 [Oratosquilla oratoria]|uniref:uncharacterized protein LOC143038461 isoform X1 n=1 Tax=Oratosquilla oratoria TaxID=337810 RepID=UPI003F774ECE